MANKSNFDDVEVKTLSSKDGKTFAKGTPAATLADLTPAAAISAATTDTSAAKLTDVQALRTVVNPLVTQVNDLKAAQVAFGQRS